LRVTRPAPATRPPSGRRARARRVTFVAKILRIRTTQNGRLNARLNARFNARFNARLNARLNARFNAPFNARLAGRLYARVIAAVVAPHPASRVGERETLGVLPAHAPRPAPRYMA
jgi:hypothetical protein